MNKLFSFYFLYNVKQMQFVTLRSPNSLIQWSVISTNFRKRLFSQIGSLVGHDRWPIIISITASVSCFEKCTWKHLQESWKNQIVYWYSVQKVLNLLLYTTLYMTISAFYLFSKPQLLAIFFRQYRFNEIPDKHKNKFMWQSYF